MFFRRKAAVVALGVLALTLAGGGIAAAAHPAAKAPAEAAQPGARQPGQQPPVTAAETRAAKAALRATLAPPAAGTVAWAVVGSNGALLQHSGNVIAATKFASNLPGQYAGQYQVTLDYDVRLKAYHASIGTDDPANVPPGGEVSVAPRTLIPNAIFVQTRSSFGGFADKPFHIVIAN
ncbi:hypothetical protein ONA91_28730 [Micromonospora sp. DR5-3]|uniref:hypothetical protein n=1 Tax=unclassified Micromonospora TaxID=2617518 RepID=UPI0011D6B9E6|nr:MULTISPECIES: hypothetical protein [unclassified Micromonospora]MCW3818434.1 hypothetical protein [Micromonospora sp. DR5-3]TYC23177.1 hypothetical protein FXF52_16895 [Micromonospora sp. MP36]